MKDRMLSKEMREKLMGEIGRNDKFIELIGIRIVELDEGYCKGELEVTDQHMNPLELFMADACTRWRIRWLVLQQPPADLKDRRFPEICIFSDRQWV